MAIVIALCGVSAHAQSKPPALVDTAALAPEYRTAAATVAKFLSEKGEKPREFFAEITRSPDGKELVFHLWHESAFDAKYRNVRGNPGGKNRDVHYNLRSGTVTGMLFWQ